MEEVDDFDERVLFPFDPSEEATEPRLEDVYTAPQRSSIRHVAAGGEFLLLTLDDKGRGGWELLLVYTSPLQYLEMRVLNSKAAGADIHRAFVDPLGDYVLVALADGELLYGSVSDKRQLEHESKRMEKAARSSHDDSLPSYPKFERVRRMTGRGDGARVTAVGWDRRRSGTRDILVGDSGGMLHELRFHKGKCELREDGSKLASVREFEGTSDDQLEVTGLEIEWYTVPPRSSQHVCIFVATQAILFTFAGEAIGDRPYRHNLVPARMQMLRISMETGGGDFTLHRAGPTSPAITFGWMTVGGIMHGVLALGAEDRCGNVLSTNKQIMPERGILLRGPGERRAAAVPDSLVLPWYKEFPVRAVAVTTLHIVILFGDAVYVLLHPPGMGWKAAAEGGTPDVSQRVVFRQRLSHGQMNWGVGIARDSKTNSIYVFSKSQLYELTLPENQEQHWYTFLKRATDPKEELADRRAYFALAEHSVDDVGRRDKIRMLNADLLFEQGRREEAAELYSTTDAPFEQTVLKFIRASDKDSLRFFLDKRLTFILERRESSFEGPRAQATQLRCICTWLACLHLEVLWEKGPEDEDYRELQSEFEDFARQHAEFIEDLVEDLIRSQAGPELYVGFCVAVGRHESAMSFLISRKEYGEAIRILTESCDSEEHASTWYMFSPVLFRWCPQRMEEAWRALDHILEPKKLIPALVRCVVPVESLHPSERAGHAAVVQCAREYMTWQLQKNRRNPARTAGLHMLLLSHYCRSETDDESQLLRFLQESCGGRGDPPFDLRMALRLCLKERKDRACVFIYSRMGLYDDAVQVALRIHDTRLAQETTKAADFPDCLRHERIEKKKKLWLEIYKYLISGRARGADDAPSREQILDAITSLEQDSVCPRAQRPKLEEILPFFPDFFHIGDFHVKIGEALDDYNRQALTVQRDIERATCEADKIRTETEHLRQRYAHVSARQACNLCGHPVLTQNFYVFPACGHVFHMRCLRRHVCDSLDAQLARARDRGRKEEQRSRMSQTDFSMASLSGLARAAQRAGGAEESLSLVAALERKRDEFQHLERQVKPDREGEAGACTDPELLRRWDEWVAAECALCGETTIEEIQEPFVLDIEQNTGEGISWRV
eukprot:TRINITY_DN9292_c0_g1_i1.p1 TRINITY_DN9292_c0_g1~~TRINITY_DN9292_c0_g1_i1.p1  ORF type:complete len:1160 (+),score=363.02 TRINITY_DN9292_c0_g1_i1:110-3481(+)